MIGDSVKYILGFLFLVLVVLAETAVLPFFPFFNTQTCLLLVTLLALQFLGLVRECYYGAFFGGILLDLLGGTIFGLSSLVLLLLSGAVGLVRRLAEGSPPILFLVTFAASVVFRATQTFPAFRPATLCQGGLMDVGVMLLVYPTLRYLLKNLFGGRELQVGI